LSPAVFAGTGTETMQFLKIKPSARATSLGDSFVSIANDASATFYNPAGLAQLDNMEISLMHMAYIAETSYEFGTIVLPAGDKLRIGAYIIFLNYGSVVKTTEDSSGIFSGNSGSYTPYDLSAAVSMGYRLSGNFNVGFNIKMALSSIDDKSLNGIMGDAGVLWKVTDEISVGGILYNIGGVMQNGDASPLTGKLGVSTKLSLMEENDLTAGVGFNYVNASAKLSESIGAEYCFRDMFSVRAGYGIGSDADGINIGAGLKQDLGGMTGTLDYNFSMLGDLGSAHRISIGLKFGQDNRSKVKSSGAKKKSVNTGIRNYYRGNK